MIQFDFSQFSTAAENMGYDKILLHRSDSTIFRIYEWTSQGITYSYKQELPQKLTKMDHAKRITGGGIVFHLPGDFVFSLSGSHRDQTFTAGLKDKMRVLADLIENAFQLCGVCVTHLGSESDKNFEFCQNYPNPYELYFQDKKILGLTIRKFRTRFLIQGIIHLNSSDPKFKFPVQFDKLKDILVRQIKLSFT